MTMDIAWLGVVVTALSTIGTMVWRTMQTMARVEAKLEELTRRFAEAESRISDLESDAEDTLPLQFFRQ